MMLSLIPGNIVFSCIFPISLQIYSNITSVALTLPPLGPTNSTMSVLVNGKPSPNYFVVLELASLTLNNEGSVVSYPLNGFMAQGVPVSTVYLNGAPMLYFDFRIFLPNGAAMLVHFQLFTKGATIDSGSSTAFQVANNNLKVRKKNKKQKTTIV